MNAIKLNLTVRKSNIYCCIAPAGLDLFEINLKYMYSIEKKYII